MKLISSGLTVIIIGLSISLMILSFGYFHFWGPYGKQATYEEGFAEKLQAESDKMPQAKKRVDTANKMVTTAESQWDQYVQVNTPPDNVRAGGIDLSVNPYQLAIDSWKYRDSVQRAVNAQIVKGGITLVGTGPAIPGPTDVNNVGGLLASYYNYPTIKYPVVIFNLGTITVTGTYKQIMDNVRAYKSMPHYLAVTDGLQLTGTAPKLTASYNLTIVGFIKAKKIFGAVPEIQSAAGRGGMGGGPGGMGGMMGGRRGGMPGGMGPSAMGGGPGGSRASALDRAK